MRVSYVDARQMLGEVTVQRQVDTVHHGREVSLVVKLRPQIRPARYSQAGGLLYYFAQTLIAHLIM